jgi:DNA-directed RNA polymerase sigma subunit (sigma70/sigma32)
MNSRENQPDSDHQSPSGVSMSEDEICLLAVRFERGDMEAVSLLFRAHLPLVVSLARQHVRVSVVSLSRLIAAGNAGLMNAIKTCVPLEKGSLTEHIRQQIEASIRQSLAQAMAGGVMKW